MSVFNSVQIRRRLWRGYDDPALPVGMWVAWIASLGDASGGDNTLDIELEAAEASPNLPGLSGNHYNLEALEIFNSGTIVVNAALVFINLSIAINGAQTNREWTINQTFNETGDVALSSQNQFSRPVFLGSKQIIGTIAAVRLVVDNDDGLTQQMWAEGYIWSARSLNAEGGLQRPARALYG